VWLFHLAEDPTEKHDVAAHEPEQVRRLQGLLDDFNREQAEPMWPSVAAIHIALDHSVATPDKPDDDYIYWPN
jgi:hypothetical protein